MGFKNKLIHLYTYLPYTIFSSASKNPEIVENRKWKRLLKLYERGDFWLKTKGKTLEEFSITDYETYKEAISSSKQTGINPMTGEKIIFFADSAGTTAYPKEFPITESFRKDYQTTQAPFIHRLTNEFPSFLESPALYITATDSSKKAACGVEIGYISNFNYRRMPKALAHFYGIPKELLRDEKTFQEWAPVYALSQNISAIFVITPLVLCHFFKLILNKRQSILDTLRNPTRIPKELPSLRISPERLEHLEAVLNKADPKIQEIWDKLSFVCTWKASLAGLQVPELQKWIPDIPILDGTYSATEAWFNVPWFKNQVGGPLCHNAGIFEFIPVGETIEKKNLVRSWQLEKGRDYEVFVTTSMGMIRYRLKDIVHCSGHVEKSPVIFFKYKAENLISLTTLRLSEEQVAQALSTLKVTDFSSVRLAPRKDGTGLLLVVKEDSGPKISIDDFEEALKHISPYYKEEREAGHVHSSQLLSLTADHPIFAQRARHAQSKPSLVSKLPLDL